MATSAASLPAPADRLVTLPDGEPELTLGWGVVAWATKYLRQPNGPRAGQRFTFTLNQLRFLLWFYAVNESGEWLYDHGVRRLAKGSGKSPYAALVALAELTAPVRLKDFDPRVKGGCVGRPVKMPLVQIAAVAESQTANTMRMVRAFAAKKSRLAQEFGIDWGQTRLNLPGEGTLQQITSSWTAAEGAETTFVVADEPEHWLPSNGGPALSATLQDNLAKSGSRMLETANAWVPGVGSVAQATFEAWVAQEEGSQRGEARILYDARLAPPGTDMGDPESLEAALRFVYDDCYWVQFKPIMNRIWRKNARRDDSERKYFNWPSVAEDAWTTPQDWALLADATAAVPDGDDIVLFFDGSKSRDATALIGCHVTSGHVFTLGVWEPDPDEGVEVPVHEVDAAVEAAFDKWSVRAFFADVREWEQFARTTWPDRYGDDLAVWAVPGGKQPAAVAWDMRTHLYEFTMAAEHTLAEIEDRAFTHDGDSRVSRHVANAREHPNRYGVGISKESPASAKKIDAAVCVIGVRMVRRLLLGSDAWSKQEKRSSRVYGFN